MTRPVASSAALADLLAHGAAGVGGLIRDTHHAIAGRAFGATGPAGAGVRVAHDGISGLVYGAVRSGLRGAVRAGGGAVAAAGLSIPDTPRGRLLLGAINGAWGDLLEEQGSPLAIAMSVPSPPAAAERTGRVVVFLHGLCETEDAWRLGADRGRESYAERLRRELGWTPLIVRYNTGRHISTNGRSLAELLDGTVRGWPVDVEEIALVGHSMGGLVARSACHHAVEAGMSWVADVRHVVSLGAPFDGADLEKAANLAASALGAVPETRALAGALNRRSAGIKDLRYGYVTDRCWADGDPDALLTNTRCEIPWLEHAQHTFIAATVTADPDHPLGRVVGDLLVRRPSAWAGGRHGEHEEFLVDRSHCVGPATHFSLLNHPDVYARLRAELAGSRALAPA